MTTNLAQVEPTRQSGGISKRGLAARLRVGMKIWLAKYLRLTSATQSGGET